MANSSTWLELSFSIGSLSDVLIRAESVHHLFVGEASVTSKELCNRMHAFIETCNRVVQGSKPFYLNTPDEYGRRDSATRKVKQEKGKVALAEARGVIEDQFVALDKILPAYRGALEALTGDTLVVGLIADFGEQIRNIVLFHITSECRTIIREILPEYRPAVSARAYGRPALAVDPSSFGVPFHLRRVRVLGGSLQSRFQ